MNEFLQLLLARIEEKTSWRQNELRKVILEEYAKMGSVRTLLQNALLPSVNDEGCKLVVKEAIKVLNREA